MKFEFMKNSRANSNSLRCKTFNFNFTYFERTNAKRLQWRISLRAGISNEQTVQLPQAPRLGVMTFFFWSSLDFGRKIGQNCYKNNYKKMRSRQLGVKFILSQVHFRNSGSNESFRSLGSYLFRSLRRYLSELERGPNLPRRDIISSRPRRDIIASRPRRNFKVTRLEMRHETL